MFPSNGWEAHVYTGPIDHTNMVNMDTLVNRLLAPVVGVYHAILVGNGHRLIGTMLIGCILRIAGNVKD